METELTAKLDVIISLLARSVIGEDEIRKLVAEGKKKGTPVGYVKAYNQLGGKSLTELAEIVGVSQPAISSVVAFWVRNGIAYDEGSPGKPRYRGVTKL